MRCYITLILNFCLCYLQTRFSWHVFCRRNLRASSSSQDCCCCPWQGWCLWLWSQWWCHRHVYTALIITLSHFNSSSVNWTASGFSRSSLLLWQLLPGGCCPLAPALAHGPLTARSRRKMPDCDPASYRIRVRVMCDVQWWVLVTCHHVMCPALPS